MNIDKLKFWLIFLFICINVSLSNELSANDAIKFTQEMLNRHNTLRRNHNVPELTLNPELVELAQNEAERCANIGSMNSQIVKYRNKGLGKNSAIYFGPDGYSGEKATNLWYEKSSSFNYQLNSLQNCGTFTQVVWKNTNEIGVGISQKNGKIFIVALYYPPGNIIGSVTQNVLPSSHSTSNVLPSSHSTSNVLPSSHSSSSINKEQDREKTELIGQIKKLLKLIEN